MAEFIPRPKQAEVLKYRKGLMGVAAVPGSGKTRTLSYLAATLVAEADLDDDQEVLIVTLVNSAVDHFSRQVAAFVRERGLLPNFGYRVRTLHGLANDIVRERPGVVGLSETFQIVDEREADEILENAVYAWRESHPDAGYQYLDPDFEEHKAQNLLRDRWPGDMIQIVRSFIKQAKDYQLDEEQVRKGIERAGQELPLATMCSEIFTRYQRSLAIRGAVDFQDLIRLALRILREDDDYLARKRHQWPFILEDEAQDSSKLQEEILLLLAGKRGNWVRVGDPNQSIYETFTTARPEYLRDFLQKGNVKARELPNSGRSTQSIINLANYLIDWTADDHPAEAIRERAPLQPPRIEPTPEGDPQPNPPDDPGGVYLWPEDLTPAEEIQAVVTSIKRWLPDHQDWTSAVLVPRNDRGAQVVRALKAEGIDVVELLRSTSSTRETAGALVYVLEALTNPNAAPSLAMAFKVWRRDDRDDPATDARLDRVVKTLRGLKQVEDYLYPRADQDWLDSAAIAELSADDDLVIDQLVEFRDLMRRWQGAVVLPIDQLILTLAQDLFDTAPDLAIAHSLAVKLRRDAAVNPLWRLPEFTAELRAIAQNKRRVSQIGDDGGDYDPDQHRGKVTIATMHSAKGLEWDRVYLMSVNNYDFPSAEPQDKYISEKWYFRDQLNLQAEALAQLDIVRQALGRGKKPNIYREGEATQAARLDYAAERLRLLYVGITRARRELILTWNTGRDGKVFQASPFIALQNYWERTAR